MDKIVKEIDQNNDNDINLDEFKQALLFEKIKMIGEDESTKI